MALAALNGEFDLPCPFQQTLPFLLGQPVVTAWAGDVQFEER
jgi:hypothetical protein